LPPVASTISADRGLSPASLKTLVVGGKRWSRLSRTSLPLTSIVAKVGGSCVGADTAAAAWVDGAGLAAVPVEAEPVLREPVGAFENAGTASMLASGSTCWTNGSLAWSRLNVHS
jgi:hypothetical protein